MLSMNFKWNIELGKWIAVVYVYQPPLERFYFVEIQDLAVLSGSWCMTGYIHISSSFEEPSPNFFIDKLHFH